MHKLGPLLEKPRHGFHWTRHDIRLLWIGPVLPGATGRAEQQTKAATRYAEVVKD